MRLLSRFILHDVVRLEYIYVCIRRRRSADVVNLSVCLARAKLETMTRGENKFIKKVIVAEIVDEIRESN